MRSALKPLGILGVGLVLGIMLQSQVNVPRVLLQKLTPCQRYGVTSSIGVETFHTYEFTPADWMDASTDVALASIEEIGRRRFATTTGRFPTPVPGEVRDPDLPYVVAPVVLRRIEGYKGSEVTGYVVARLGGRVLTCPGYTFEFDPEPMIGRRGQRGMAFLEEPPAEWAEDLPMWFAHVMATADRLSANGVMYRPMLLRNWYLYEGDEARSGMQDEVILVAAVEKAVR